MKARIRLLSAILISVLPSNPLRVACYRALLGYRITSSKLGIGAVIDVPRAHIADSLIGRFTRIRGPMTVEIYGARIGASNMFRCGDWTVEAAFSEHGYRRSLTIQKGCLITTGHFFDVAGALTVGKGTWIAGRGSQFWTHGAGVRDRDISIGEDCYVSSATLFAPGSSIGNRVLVAMGSVVTRPIAGDRQLVGGTPAAVIREDYDWPRAEKV